MLDWLIARKNAAPDKTALVMQGQAYTFAELNMRVWETSVRLQEHVSIRPGEHAAILLPTGIDYVLTFFALMRMQVVIVPLNTRLITEELKLQVTNADCRFVICNSETEGQATPLASSVYRVLSFDKTQSAEVETLSHINSKNYGHESEIGRLVDLDAPLAIIHTSGTSGRPKGVVLTYGNFFYSTMASAYRLGHLPDDRWLSVLPLYHVGGLSIIIRAVLYGIPVDLRLRFDADEINNALVQDEITLVSLVPTMLYRLLEQGTPKDWQRLRLILLGGAAASPELLEQSRKFGLPVATTYGLTETASQVATMLLDGAADKPGSVGKPLMFSRVQIVDDSGQPVTQGTYGEITVSGPTVMHEYYADAEATANSLRDGWLHTGDIGYLDADGDLWVVQRRSDLIVSGGENVYPAEVEAVIRQHPAVAEAVVVGIDHPEWGQQVGALIVLSKAIEPTEIINFLRQHLSGYKLPRRMHFTDHLPQTASGKIHVTKAREALRHYGTEV